MLIPGIKLGPTDWLEKLDAAKPKAAEIWYRIDWSEKYGSMIGELHKRGVVFGFHFWGVTSFGYEANLAYPGQNQAASLELMHRCIDEAAAAGAHYVNIHCGNYALMIIDFENESLYPDDTKILLDPAEAAVNRNKCLYELGSYANQKGVALLVEAVPSRVANGNWWNQEARLHPLEEYPAPLTGIEDLCQQKLIGFTNDFCHTLTMNIRTSEVRTLADLGGSEAYEDFMATTKLLVPYTKVIHVNTLTAPFNGTDSHGGVLPDDFADPIVFPTRQQFLDLFKLLSKNEEDILLIGEPKDKHVENYFALQQLLNG